MAGQRAAGVAAAAAVEQVQAAELQPHPPRVEGQVEVARTARPGERAALPVPRGVVELDRRLVRPGHGHAVAGPQRRQLAAAAQELGQRAGPGRPWVVARPAGGQRHPAAGRQPGDGHPAAGGHRLVGDVEDLRREADRVDGVRAGRAGAGAADAVQVADGAPRDVRLGRAGARGRLRGRRHAAGRRQRDHHLSGVARLAGAGAGQGRPLQPAGLEQGHDPAQGGHLGGGEGVQVSHVALLSPRRRGRCRPRRRGPAASRRGRGSAAATRPAAPRGPARARRAAG